MRPFIPAASIWKTQGIPRMSGKDARDDSRKAADPGRTAGEKPSGEKTDDGGFIVFDSRIEIYYGQHIPRLDAAENKAYRAFAMDKDRTPLVAIVCERHLVPRISAAGTYAGISNAALMQLIRYGKAYWPPARQECFVLIYMDHPGKPILKKGERAALGWRQDDVINEVIVPMVDVFLDFRDRDFVHGAIHPLNMFDIAAPARPRKIVFGDCLSTPAFYALPALYQTVERAMADPVARGRGTLADDLYAFGVSLAVLLRQNDPMFEMSDAEIIRNKVLFGSYVAVTGKDRFRGEVLELLRGLLHDDPSQRWKVDEIQVWLDGRRLTPKQSITAKKARRAIAFGNEKFLLMSLLAMVFGQNLAETRRVVDDDSLYQWLERAVGDEAVMLRFDKALVSSRLLGVGPGYEERLASNLSIALDPSAPIRYKNMSMTCDGIGAALARAVVLKQPLAPFAELISNGVAMNWLAAQESPSADSVGMHSKLESCRRFLRSNKPGEGLERVLYLLCSDAPCLSEAVANYYVVRPGDLLLAFEDLCKKNKAPSMFLDRHSVAFLMQRDSRVIEPYVFDLNTQDRRKIVLTNLRCLAAIQRRYDTGQVPFVTKMLAEMVPIVFERYHDRTTREKLKKGVEECAESGDLQKLSALLDNSETISRDYGEFRKAMLEYSAIEKERQAIEAGLVSREGFGLEAGREWSAIVSSVLAGISILVIAAMFLSDKPFLWGP